jgi:CBS-domain-containing membrane protein
MCPASVVFSPEMTRSEALERVRESPLDAWPVVGEDGLLGMLRRRDLSGPDSRQHVRDFFPEDLNRNQTGSANNPHVHPDHPLSLALERMGACGLNVLPVVNRANVRELIGIVALDYILKMYGLEHLRSSPDKREQ